MLPANCLANYRHIELVRTHADSANGVHIFQSDFVMKDIYSIVAKEFID